MIGNTQSALYFGKSVNTSQQAGATAKNGSGAASDASKAGSAANATNAASDQTAAGSEDRFMTLLVAQMRNQDPLNPLDNAQVTSQLAQINTVRGIEQLNQTVNKIVASNGGFSPSSAVGLLGRQVLVPGDSFQWSGGTRAGDGAPSAVQGARIGFEVADAARQVRLDVLDASGRVVFSRGYDQPTAGLHTFDWDGSTANGGTAAAGKYKLRAVGVAQNGSELKVDTLVTDRVGAVTQGAQGAQLELASGATQLSSAIRSVF